MKLINKCLLLSLILSSNAFADGFSASVGGDYSTGKYGSSSSTDVFYLPLQAAFETGAFTFKLTVPWIMVTGDGSVVPGGLSGSGSGVSGTSGTFGCAADNRKGASKPEDDGPCAGVTTTTTTATTTTARTTNSGLGDVILAATYNLLDGGDKGFVVDLTGRVKFPTASKSRGLGSGKTDYAVQVNVDKNFEGGAYLSTGFGFRVLGKPAGVDYDNVVYGSFGGGYKFTKMTSAGVSFDWATASVKGASSPQEVSIYASHKINDQYKLSGVIYTGITDASPDVGGGATLHYYF